MKLPYQKRNDGSGLFRVGPNTNPTLPKFRSTTECSYHLKRKEKSKILTFYEANIISLASLETLDQSVRAFNEFKTCYVQKKIRGFRCNYLKKDLMSKARRSIF